MVGHHRSQSQHEELPFYQVIGGAAVTSLGNSFVDADLLRIAGAAKDLWRITDFASDKLVLQLASAKTIAALSNLADTEDVSSIVSLSLLLFFILHVHVSVCVFACLRV